MLIPRVFILMVSCFVAGCGGGGGSKSSENSQSSVDTNASGNVNGGMTGKIYFNSADFFMGVDLSKGEIGYIHQATHGGEVYPSPDGQEFSLDGNESEGGGYGKEDIVFFNESGQDTGRITVIGKIYELVKISPQKDNVMFYWHTDENDFGLTLMSRTTDWYRIFGKANHYGYDWTPDGSLIYSSGNDIYKVDDVVAGAPELIASMSGSVYAVTVSPDGKKIAFSLSPSGSKQEGHIYVMAINGESLHQVTTSDLWEGAVAWSPDSKYLAVVRGDMYVNVDGNTNQGNIAPRIFIVDENKSLVDVSDKNRNNLVEVKYFDNRNNLTMSATPTSMISWR